MFMLNVFMLWPITVYIFLNYAILERWFSGKSGFQFQ